MVVIRNVIATAVMLQGNRAHTHGPFQIALPRMVAIIETAQDPAQGVKEEKDALG
jgi:hypothetical protein